LPQNAVYFAAKRDPFCRKMESILPQNGKHLLAIATGSPMKMHKKKPTNSLSV